jgi:chemosensory pili system protein ChpC
MEAPATDLYSLLIPLAEERLIVPRASVAEVIAWQAPDEMQGAPAWYLGTIGWNGRNVPVASFEGACGQAIPTPSGRTRIVVFYCLGQKLQSGFFGVLTQGFPQLVRVNPDVLKPDGSRTFGERSPVLCQVRMINETPLIPDLERLEEMLSEETSVAA